MPLKPIDASVDDSHEQEEIRSLSRKFWIGLILTVPVFLLAMGGMIPALGLAELIPRQRISRTRRKQPGEFPATAGSLVLWGFLIS
jgi:hypothetical protein